ncbi:hypothetical protein HG537_0H03390 [Torulaspora globosa]|uniref:RAVE complex protein Rav1 C-terminal domain-containing protein n=1 Tax=Torulaspora globosa TaxID=48254 RepID=A0A7H9I157_9SACH|nr:hypothetical protein HG537_0H03390 [Torulaspora sp. CBS 2947]
MSLRFLPGRPNDTQGSTCQVRWQEQIIFAYCSGNNVILLSNQFSRLQTIYLEEDAVAVDINPANGFIAVAFGKIVNIYKPIHQVMKTPKWEFCCQIFHDDSRVNSLCWGDYNEIVIGTNYLSFWKLRDEFGEYKPVLLWNKRQPKPVYQCKVSENSQLIASFGKYDSTVKLWRRISISGEQDIFNLTLLPHGAPVTTIRWKKSGPKCNDKEFNELQVIYILCTDKRLRVWSCYETESNRTVQQWGSLQLNKEQRYCLLIDNWILRKCLGKNFSNLKNIDEECDLALLGSPEGRFDVFVLTGLSVCPPRPMGRNQLPSKQIRCASFVNDPDFVYFAEVQPYDGSSEMMSVVVHDLRGVIRQSVFSVKHLFDNEHSEIGELQNKLTGHNKSVQRLVRSSDGEAMLTISRFSENCVWRPNPKDSASLQLTNIINTEKPIKLAIIHEKGQLVICLLENSKIQAWHCPRNRDEKKRSLLKAEYELPFIAELGEPILMLNTPEQRHNHERHFIALIYRDGTVKAFKVSFTTGIEEIQSKGFNIATHRIYRISTIDPVHSHFYSNRPLITLTTEKGLITTYKAVVDYEAQQIKWIKDSEVNTGIENIALIRGSSTGKLCIADSTGRRLSLWDMKRGVLEYEESFDDIIEDIDWTSTAFGQSIVSIGFKSYALLYTQLRYDYTNHNPSYLPIEKIDITTHTDHDIGDSIWLKDGTFVVASGNQFYVKDKYFDQNDPFTHHSIGSRKIFSNDILHLSSVLNGPLPVYHPQFLIQALFANKLQLTKEILLRLFLELRKLNFRSEDLVNLSSNLHIGSEKFLVHHDRDYPKTTFPDPFPEYNAKVSAALTEQLTKVALPYLTRHQQITIITVIGALNDIMENESVVDYNGIRFLLGVKLFMSHKNTQKELLMRDVAWALHSDNKELLLTICGSNIVSWEKAREFKVACWCRESDLLNLFEQIAKYEFSGNETRDPSRCAIFYLALKKKEILISLWKISFGHPEQQKMLKFLSNDFSQPRWRSAALKNAFVLMSKHRFMDAACFFLLAKSLEDAANVLYKQVKDMDLAIAVCRVYEGDNGPALGNLLSKQVLPEAIIQNDRWMTSFIYWKLRKQHIAIKALVTQPIDLEQNAKLVNEESCIKRSFLVEDPALLILYSHLRKRNINYFMGSLEVENRLEYNSVLRVTDILKRMGCEYLALSLARNWEFIKEDQSYESIVQSSKLDEAGFNITSIANEPIKTKLVRPSLFDKFLATDSTLKNSRVRPNNVASRASTKNLLDDFMVSSSIQNSPRNLLDEFSSSNSNSASTASQSILNEYSLNSCGTESSTDGFKDMSQNNANPVKNAPRSLLDDFM